MNKKPIGITYLVNGVDAQDVVSEFEQMSDTERAMEVLSDSKTYRDYTEAKQAMSRYSDESSWQWRSKSDHGL